MLYICFLSVVWGFKVWKYEWNSSVRLLVLLFCLKTNDSAILFTCIKINITVFNTKNYKFHIKCVSDTLCCNLSFFCVNIIFNPQPTYWAGICIWSILLWPSSKALLTAGSQLSTFVLACPRTLTVGLIYPVLNYILLIKHTVVRHIFRRS